MDFKKLKDIAKTAVDKTAEGLDKANEMRKSIVRNKNHITSNKSVH